jgi:hypothetical protein
MTLVENLPPGANFATGTANVVDTGGKFATSVNDTGFKFAAGVNKTGGNNITLVATISDC